MSNTTGIPAELAVEKVLEDLKGFRAFLAGSAAAAIAHDKPMAYTDVDVFTPNQGVYYTAIQRLKDSGYSVANDRFELMWDRQMNIGFNKWHTNSMKLIDDLTGTEVNVIYKLVDGHETTSLSQVIESFDFGLLGMGFDLHTSNFHDMRSYLFPGFTQLASQTGWGIPLPLLEYRHRQLSRGLMSQHIMLRTPGRYARYAGEYGYDLSLVKPVLIDGYIQYSSYKLDRTKPEDRALGEIAKALAIHLEDDAFDELQKFEQELPKADGLDQVLASLE